MELGTGKGKARVMEEARERNEMTGYGKDIWFEVGLGTLCWKRRLVMTLSVLHLVLGHAASASAYLGRGR